jgi:hypothetical protein
MQVPSGVVARGMQSGATSDASTVSLHPATHPWEGESSFCLMVIAVSYNLEQSGCGLLTLCVLSAQAMLFGAAGGGQSGGGLGDATVCGSVAMAVANGASLGQVVQ